MNDGESRSITYFKYGNKVVEAVYNKWIKIKFWYATGINLEGLNIY